MKESIPYFEKVLEGNIQIESHIFGLSYYYLILIYKDLDNTEILNRWYKKLLNSDIEDKETFIKELKNKLDLQ